MQRLIGLVIPELLIAKAPSHHSHRLKGFIGKISTMVSSGRHDDEKGM